MHYKPNQQANIKITTRKLNKQYNRTNYPKAATQNRNNKKHQNL